MAESVSKDKLISDAIQVNLPKSGIPLEKWKELMEEEGRTECAYHYTNLIINDALKIIRDEHYNSMAIPFTVHCFHRAFRKVIKMGFLHRDPEVRFDWVDSVPETCPADPWASSVMPCLPSSALATPSPFSIPEVETLPLAENSPCLSTSSMEPPISSTNNGSDSSLHLAIGNVTEGKKSASVVHLDSDSSLQLASGNEAIEEESVSKIHTFSVLSPPMTSENVVVEGKIPAPVHPVMKSLKQQKEAEKSRSKTEALSKPARGKTTPPKRLAPSSRLSTVHTSGEPHIRSPNSNLVEIQWKLLPQKVEWELQKKPKETTIVSRLKSTDIKKDIK